MEMPNLSDGDVISACISKDFFMKAPDESSIIVCVFFVRKPDKTFTVA